MFPLVHEEIPCLLGEHQTVTLGLTSFSPTPPTAGANYLMVQAVTQNIRYSLSAGQEPTAAIGFQLVASAVPVIIPLGGGVTPRFFREAAGAILQYQYLK